MKSLYEKNLLKFVAATALCMALVYAVSIHAQQNPGKAGTTSLTTNWVGCVVTGKNDPADRISPGPFPATLPDIELGLRSDGVVVWRAKQNKK